MAKAALLYASVKAYGQKGKLLSRADLQALAESRSMDELLTRIKNTRHAAAVADLQAPHTAAGIEAALGAGLAEAHHSMARAAGGRGVLDAYYRRLVVWNLKVVLKGKALGKPQDEIERHVNMRAAELVRERDTLVKALVSKDLEEAAASLRGTRLGEDVARAVALYGERGHIQAIDTHLDRVVHQDLARAARESRERGVARMIGADVDFYNVMAVLRARLWGLDETAILGLTAGSTPGVPRAVLERMAGASSVRDALAELGATRYASLVPQSGTDLDAVAGLERAMEMAIYDSCNRAFTRMFSLTTIIAITKLAAYEVRNVSAIAYAVEQGIPAETVMARAVVAEQE
ncbi:MAG: ATPase [Thaumarchaeota archaeon S13]|nr:MAG: ATPase [Thaumarchaeota archaeon S13]